jgi:transcriptional regulator with XRE-family HTH domain
MPGPLRQGNDRARTQPRLTNANHLERTRVAEGLSLTRLASLAGVSVKTVDRAEAADPAVTARMKHKIVKGLNKNPDRTREFTFREIFPNDREY